VAGGLAIAVLATACSGAKAKGHQEQSPPPTTTGTAQNGGAINAGFTQRGGTVRVLEPANFEHLDPAEVYAGDESDFGRLIFRTLTIIDDTPGREPTIKPDLAQDLGTPSDGAKTWTFRLRHGLTYEDGTPITAADIKYGVERSFAQDVFPDAPPYLRELLANPDHYVGPYKDPGQDLASVQTPDPFTIVFHFAAPQPDAQWMLSLHYTAPVPKAKDTERDYAFHPVASGPYKIQSYTPDKSISIVRNAKWDAATDPNRPALPDRYEVTFGLDRSTISQRLIADQGADQNAVTLVSSLQNGDLPKLRQPSVKSRFITGSGHSVGYVVFNEAKLKDPDIRKAIALAINRQAIQTEEGGELFGSITNTILPEGIGGRKPIDLGLKPTGDPDAARKLLAGKTVPTLHFGVSSTSTKGKTMATQVQNDLKAIGINLVIDQIPSDSYNKTLFTDKAPELFRSGFQPDWPTAAAVVPAVLGPDASGKTWVSTNFSRYFDPAVSPRVTQAASVTDPQQMGQQLNDLTNQILSTNWPLLPTIEARNPQVVGSNVRNAGLSTYYGQIDLLRIGVQH
jgi:peptide/nickel transport system substrate-binding protein